MVIKILGKLLRYNENFVDFLKFRVYTILHLSRQKLVH